MEKQNIIPDVVKVLPLHLAKISYPSGVIVDQGNVLTPYKTKDEPKVKWYWENESLYTLCMTDPDAPCRQVPTFREWQHWLVGNIPGNSVSRGEVLAEYIGPGPPMGTAMHRYIFLIYKQKGYLNFTEPRLPNNSAIGRGGFRIQEFADKYKLGVPVAGNFFLAEYDNYVPKLYERLRGY